MIVIKIKPAYDIDVYTASYCGWCTKTKDLLKNDGIMYNEKPLDDGAFLQQNSYYKDYLTITQNEKLNEFNGKITQLYMSIVANNSSDENVEGVESHYLIDTFFNELTGKNSEDFFSVIKNVEVSEENKVVNELANYLSENKSLIYVYNDFYNFKDKIIQNQNEFFAHADKGEISVTIPQIFIDGEVFPRQHNPEVRDLGTYGELNRCIDIYGDANSCFLEFANNREQFNETMFPVLPEIVEEMAVELPIIDSLIGVAV